MILFLGFILFMNLPIPYKKIVFFFLAFSLNSNFSSANADPFVEEAKSLASDLKTSLMKNLSEKIAKEGVEKAIPFCHENVKSVAQTAAGKARLEKYQFGRTSHKIRNGQNTAQPWAQEYLKVYQGTTKETFKGDPSKQFIIHQFVDGPKKKRIYLEPLYVEAKCLLCHGENISPSVQKEIKKLYPDDQATGFKQGEFRGFIWVKEK